ncbi:MAG: outer membrane protein transport protein [Myxococcaceae bacterium]
MRLLLLVSSLVAATANASGFYFGENGATALIQGGAFTGQADDLTAVNHNPAGLAQWTGFKFLVDNEIIHHDASFLRQDSSVPAGLTNSATNTDGAFYLPFVAAGYGFNLGNRRLTVSLGLYGPPSVGQYSYPEPDYERDSKGAYVNNPKKFAPQRYELVKNNIIILYPSLSVGFEVLPNRIWVGGSLQYVYSSFEIEQVLYSGLTPMPTLKTEDPFFDSTVKLKLNGKPGVTGILGVLARATDWLQVGASVRPPLHIEAEGQMELGLGEAATALGTKVSGDKAGLAINFPLEVRAGLYARPLKQLGINFDFVYQGWQSVHEIVLSPENVSLQIGSNAPQTVSAFHIPKNWHHTISFRLGASFDLLKYVTLHAGAWYETAAADDQYVTVDFMHFDRVFITGGATVHFAPLGLPVDLVLGIAGSPTVTKNVTDSKVLAANTDPTIAGGVVGNGLYNSGGYVLTGGIRGHFGGAPPPPEPAPAAAPASSAGPQTQPAPAN